MTPHEKASLGQITEEEKEVVSPHPPTQLKQLFFPKDENIYNLSMQDVPVGVPDISNKK